MGFLDTERFDLGADCQADASTSMQALQKRAEHLERQIQALDDEGAIARHTLELAEALIDLDRRKQAWESAYPYLSWFVDKRNWQQAVRTCDILFRTGQPLALAALGHGLWLSITFPVDPELTILQLRHVIDETPEDSDGAAVAAAVAAYVADIRGSDNMNDDATLVVGQLYNDVARRHGGVETPEQFEQWVRKLELDQPSRFLVRMRNVIDVLVQDNWWIDRKALQALIPA